MSISPQFAWPQPGRLTTPEPFPGPHPWADPMYYGAQGDGKHDDSAAFQAAVNAASANGSGAGGTGGYVLLGAYTYKIGASLTVPSNVSFLSFGATLTGVGAGSVGPIVVMDTAGNLVAKSLTVLSSGPYAAASGIAAGQVVSATHPWDVLAQADSADPTGVNPSGAAFNDALNGAIALGGAVEAPAGIFSIDRQLVLGPNLNANYQGGVIVQGEGKLATILRPTAALAGGSSVLKIFNARNNCIRDLRIQGTPVGQTAVDACIETNRETGATVTTTNNDFYELILGDEGSTPNQSNKGIKGTSSVDTNDELNVLINVETRYNTTSAVSIEHSNALQWRIVSGQFSGTTPVGIATAGGSFHALGVSFATVANWWVQLNAGTQRHSSALVNCTAEGTAGAIQAANTVAGAVVKFLACEFKGGPGNGNNWIDFQATTNSRLRLQDVLANTGQSVIISVTDASAFLAISDCELGVATITCAGHLRLRDNAWIPGSVTITAGAASVVQDGDAGGGFTAGQVLRYAGDVLAGLGIPTIVAQTILSAQTGSIAATDLYVPAAAGEYFAMFYVEVTTAGTGGTVQAALVARDDIGAFTQNMGSNLALNAGNRTSDHYYWRHNPTNHVQYQTTVAGATGNPQYRLVMTLLRFA